MPLAAGAELGVTPTERVGDLLRAYLDDSRLFVEALEELQGQLGLLEEYRSSATPQESAVLRRVAEKAPSAAFTAYLGSSAAARRPRPHLAQQIDDNLRLLQILRKEMSGYVAGIEEVQAVLHSSMVTAVGAADQEGLPASLNALPVVDVNLAAAALADALREDVELIARVGGDVSLVTPAEQVGSYATLLRIQPHLSEALLAEVLSWQRVGGIGPYGAGP